MMIAVSPKTLRNSALSWVLKPSMWASISSWISVGGLLLTAILLGGGAQSATDSRRTTAPEALDLAEARPPQRRELIVQREVPVLTGPRREVVMGVLACDPVLNHACSPAIEHERVEPRSISDRGVEVEEYASLGQCSVN